MRQLPRLMLALVLTAKVALADDPRKDEAVVLPLSDGIVSFTPKDKKLRLQYAYLGTEGTKGLLALVRVAAPLDEDARMAAFLDENRLVNGFEATLSLGYDRRSLQLQEYDRLLADLDAALTSLGTLSDEELSGQVEDWCLANGVTPCGLAAIVERQATLLGSTVTIADDASRADKSWTALDAVVAAKMGPRDLPPTESARGGAFARKVLDWLDAGLRGCNSETLLHSPDRASSAREWTLCSADGVVLRGVYENREAELALELAREKLRQTAHGRALVDRLWDELLRIDGPKMRALQRRGVDRITTLERNAKEVRLLVATAAKALRNQTALEQRDLNLLALSGSGVWWSISGEISGSLDRVKARKDSVSAAKLDVTNFDVQYGANGAIYLPSKGVHLNLRVGGETAQKTTLKQFERCEMLSGGSGDVTGKLCDAKANWVKGEVATTPETSGYIRLALGKQFLNSKPADSEFIPGLEVRASLEQLGAKTSVPQFGLRLSFFATPLKDSLAGRVGVAVAANMNLATSADGSVRQGDWTITPVAFIGATTSALAGR